MTLFPDAIDAMMGQSIIGRAQAKGLVTITAHQIREYTTNKQMRWMIIPTAEDGEPSCRRTRCTAAGTISVRRRGNGYTPSIFPLRAGVLTSRWPRS